MTTSLPAVLFIDDLCEALRISRRSLQRMRHHRVFPIPELHGLDGRPRWSREAVERYLAGQQPAARGWKRA